MNLSKFEIKIKKEDSQRESERDSVTDKSDDNREEVNKLIKEFQSLAGTPCKGSLMTVRKLQSRSTTSRSQFSSSRTNYSLSPKFTEFNIAKLRSYEYKPEELTTLLTKNLEKVHEEIDKAEIQQEQIVHIMEREKSQKYFNQQKLAEIKREIKGLGSTKAHSQSDPKLLRPATQDALKFFSHVHQERRVKLHHAIGVLKSKREMQAKKMKDIIARKRKEHKQEIKAVEQGVRNYNYHAKKVEKFEVTQVVQETNLLHVKKLNNEVKDTFAMLDDLLHSFELYKGRESIVLKQFQNVMAPLIVRLLDKLREYSHTSKMMRGRIDTTMDLEKELLQDPIFSDLKLLYQNYCEKIMHTSSKQVSEKQIVSNELVHAQGLNVQQRQHSPNPKIFDRMDLNVDVSEKLNIPTMEIKLERSKSFVNTNVFKDIIFKAFKTRFEAKDSNNQIAQKLVEKEEEKEPLFFKSLSDLTNNLSTLKIKFDNLVYQVHVKKKKLDELEKIKKQQEVIKIDKSAFIFK